MLNELYTFAEPVQVVPFSNLKWGKFTLLHTVNSSFDDIQVDMSFSKTWKRKPTAISSYRTDARHDLAKVVTGKGYDHTIAARGVTTVVLDFSNSK